MGCKLEAHGQFGGIAILIQRCRSQPATRNAVDEIEDHGTQGVGYAVGKIGAEEESALRRFVKVAPVEIHIQWIA